MSVIINLPNHHSITPKFAPSTIIFNYEILQYYLRTSKNNKIFGITEDCITFKCSLAQK